MGLLSGLLGVGGGTMMVPVFKIGYAMSAIASTATSLFTIILTSASGVVTHLQRRTCYPRIGLAAGLGGACTSPVGVWLASISPEWAIVLAVVVILVYSAITMLRKAIRMKPTRDATPRSAAAELAAPSPRSAAAELAAPSPRSAAAEPTVPSPHSAGTELAVPSPHSAGTELAAPLLRSAGACSRAINEEDASASDTNVAHGCAPELTRDIPIGPRECAIALCIGLLAGVASGYVGVGGGFLMVPLMMQLLHLPMKMTSGTSLIAVFILAIPGTTTQALMGNVQWIAGISIAIGSVPGAYVGSRLIPRVPERALRFMFAGMLLVAAILMVFNA